MLDEVLKALADLEQSAKAHDGYRGCCCDYACECEEWGARDEREVARKTELIRSTLLELTKEKRNV